MSCDSSHVKCPDQAKLRIGNRLVATGQAQGVGSPFGVTACSAPGSGDSYRTRGVPVVRDINSTLCVLPQENVAAGTTVQCVASAALSCCVDSLELEVLGTGPGCNTDSPPTWTLQGSVSPQVQDVSHSIIPTRQEGPRVWRGQVGQVPGTLCRLQARIQPITGSNEIQGADGRPSPSIRTHALWFRCEALLE